MSSFACEKDHDIENFLREQAVRFELIGKSRTFLIYDEDELDNGRFSILGYFTLALKSLFLPDIVSNRKRFKLDGFSSKWNDEPVRDIPCYLIGQLAKNSNIDIPKNILNGRDLINMSCEKIRQSAENTAGRWILVECHNHPKLLSFYIDNGFKYAFKEPDDSDDLVQLIRGI